MKDVHELIKYARGENRLKEIDSAVSPRHELSEILRRVMQRHGPALLFKNIEGHDIPVAANLFGDEKTIAAIFGVDDFAGLEARADEFMESLESVAADAFNDELKRRNLMPLIEEQDEEGDCIDGADNPLDRLPIPTFWPGDGGPYITLPVVITRGRDGSYNAGIYRLMKVDGAHLALHWDDRRGGARHWHEYESVNEPMPVTVVLGGPPALIFAAMAPLPESIDERQFAGLLMKSPLKLRPGRYNDIPVPTTAEIVIEGELRPAERYREGPFGNHTGFYVPEASMPLLRVRGMFLRAHAVMPVTMVGPPPAEDLVMARALTSIFLPLLRRLAPGLEDFAFIEEGTFHGISVITVAPGADAQEVIHRVRRYVPGRFLAAFESGANLWDYSFLIWKIINSVDTAACRVESENRLVALDCTGQSDERAPLSPDDDTVKLVDRRWSDYGLE